MRSNNSNEEIFPFFSGSREEILAATVSLSHSFVCLSVSHKFYALLFFEYNFFVGRSVYHQIHTLVFLLFGGVYNFFVCLSVSHSFLIFSLISSCVLHKSSILVFILYNIVYNFFVCLSMSHSFFNNWTSRGFDCHSQVFYSYRIFSLYNILFHFSVCLS